MNYVFMTLVLKKCAQIGMLHKNAMMWYEYLGAFIPWSE